MKILVYPYDKNPYQKLLYSAVTDSFGKKVTIKYLWFLPYIGALHIPLELLLCRLLGYQIIHIHWIAFYLKIPFFKREFVSYYLSRLNLYWMKLLGYKVIWTVHDITPHQRETINDLELSKLVSNTADLKIVHSNFSITQMADKGLNVDNTEIVPHGNYVDYYTDSYNRITSRKRLNIPSEKFVILFFGIIKSYKGIEDLLEAYDRLRTDDTILLIAGKIADDTLKNKFAAYNTRSDVILVDQFIPNSEVSMYYQASDIVCAPFKAITTSGSMLLALSFYKPIVTPSIGALTELPKNIGYIYDPDQPKALELALSMAIKYPNKNATFSENAKVYIKKLDWSVISERTYELYSRVLNNHK